MVKPEPSTICWIASYPRSGNTWLRFLITALFKGTDVSSADLESVVPDIHEFGRKGKGNIYNPVHGTYFIKTHWLFDTSRDVFNSVNKCVYILRNPMDVLASHLNFVRFDHDGQRQRFIDAFIEEGGAPQWFPHLMGSWRDNALSWIRGPKESIVVIYEDMLSSPVNELSKISDFLQQNISSGKLEELVDAYKFETLQKKEAVELAQKTDGLFKDFSENRAEKSHFIQMGRANYFREFLSDESVDSARRVFISQMKDIEAALGHQIKSWSIFD